MKRLLSVFFILVTSFSTYVNSQQIWSIEATALTGYYQYDADEVKNKLPENFQAGLDGNDLIGEDDDLINYSVSLGYHLNPDTLVKFTFVDGIDLDPFLQDFCFALCSDDNLRFDLDMLLYEVDLEYTAHRFNDQFSLFVGGGVTFADLDGKLFSVDGQDRSEIASVSQSESGFKGAIGLNWQFSYSFSLTLGHQRHSLFDMTKTYLSMRYQF